MSSASRPLIIVEGLAKTFVLHNAGGAVIPVFERLHMEVRPGECVVLSGESGVGKSTLMRSIYGNYAPSSGSVRVLHDGDYTDITQASPHAILDVRRRTLGYVSQFLRVIPRVPPATFSGGEQQRVNIARSFIRQYPVMLLDEPTASLDAENRAIVVELIRGALTSGTAMIGIFHDADVRDAVATRLFPVLEFKVAA